MSDSTALAAPQRFDAPTHPAGKLAFLAVLLAGLGYAAFNIFADIQHAGEHDIATGALLLLGAALLIALGFEFVNGFHDTANAVATVIYTHSLPPLIAVIWSGAFNFLGVMVSTGAVAFTVVTLLPIELILQAGSGAGYAMVFALLIAAIIWNLGTWAMGLPNSSSHALIGSIIGVGLANQLLAQPGAATSGVEWDQAIEVLKALLFSPLLGFGLAGALLLLLKFAVRSRTLFQSPTDDQPPPWPIRALLILTCTGVSFFHGSNDGQKGMGLIMLILIGAAPTAYALNRAIPEGTTAAFLQATQAGQRVFEAHRGLDSPPANASDARATVEQALRTKAVARPATYAALAILTADIARQVQSYGAIKAVPATATANVRSDMYLASDAVRVLGPKPAGFSPDDIARLASLRASLDSGTRYIPTWVKSSVALALGLGTMVGWRRIVVTVGERIGKAHLTYAEGASAEIVAMATIGLADAYGLPVSTTHVLSSGVAGAMAANGSGLQWSTIRSMAAAWVLTLPAAMAMAGLLYAAFRQIF